MSSTLITSLGGGKAGLSEGEAVRFVLSSRLITSLCEGVAGLFVGCLLVCARVVVSRFPSLPFGTVWQL